MTTPNKTTSFYVAIIKGVNGTDYVLKNDGGHGPMSTGSDEWCVATNYSIGNVLSHERGLQILANPDVGWGKAPAGTLTLYNIELNAIETIKTPVRIDPVELRRQVALAKLTAEDKRALGL